MINTLHIFLATLAFVAFGYLSLVRILYKQQIGDFRSIAQTLSDLPPLIYAIGSSALFVALPATSLLLFWGWGPALLWLVIFHLLFETVFHLHLSNSSPALELKDTLRADGTKLSAMMAGFRRGLWRALMIFLSAMLLTQLANMLDQQSGLFWALLFLLPAYGLLKSANPALPEPARQMIAGGLLLFGFLLADKIGIAVYGSWAPFGTQLEWLLLNNATILALGLLVAVVMLSTRPQFGALLTQFSGTLSIALLLILIGGLAWMQPMLDAPLLSTQLITDNESIAPPFLALCLLMFGSLLGLFVRLVGFTNNDASDAKRFTQLQSLGLVQLVFSLLLVLALAAALGIGAWKTHYLNWNWQSDFLRHYELALTTLFDMAANPADIGSMAHTLFMAVASYIGLCLLLNCFKQIDISENETASHFIRPSTILYSGLIFLLCCYFLLYGVALEFWLLAGMLAWFLLTHYLLALSAINSAAMSTLGLVFSGLSLFVFVFGAAQLSYFAYHWALQNQYLMATSSASLLLFAALSGHREIKTLLLQFRSIKDPALFE